MGLQKLSICGVGQAGRGHTQGKLQHRTIPAGIRRDDAHRQSAKPVRPDRRLTGIDINAAASGSIEIVHVLCSDNSSTGAVHLRCARQFLHANPVDVVFKQFLAGHLQAETAQAVAVAGRHRIVTPDQKTQAGPGTEHGHLSLGRKMGRLAFITGIRRGRTIVSLEGDAHQALRQLHVQPEQFRGGIIVDGKARQRKRVVIDATLLHLEMQMGRAHATFAASSNALSGRERKPGRNIKKQERRRRHEKNRPPKEFEFGTVAAKILQMTEGQPRTIGRTQKQSVPIAHAGHMHTVDHTRQGCAHRQSGPIEGFVVQPVMVATEVTVFPETTGDVNWTIQWMRESLFRNGNRRGCGGQARQQSRQ